ncbi:hypothetical protein ACIQRC_34075 [Streptomyces californicus]|uniref:hypothetical protein n=1 Tax=Streptomyces californicus TaxID=67351 RepID=UPI003828C21D
MNRNRAAHFAAAYALFRMAADYADHWGQPDFDAQCKGATDEAPVTYKHEDTGEEMTVGTKGGRAACTRHVASLGVAPSAGPVSPAIAQFSGLGPWTVGVRQVSQTEAVAR